MSVQREDGKRKARQREGTLHCAVCFAPVDGWIHLLINGQHLGRGKGGAGSTPLPTVSLHALLDDEKQNRQGRGPQLR